MSDEVKSRSWIFPESPSPAAGSALETPGEEASSLSGGDSGAGGREAEEAEGAEGAERAEGAEGAEGAGVACTCILVVQCSASGVQSSVLEVRSTSPGVRCS